MMAIDTEDKRRSTLRLEGSIVPLPIPNSSIDAGDRVHIWNYRGIAIAAPAEASRIILDRGNLRGAGTGTLSGYF